MKHNMTKKEFSTEVKDRVRKLQEKMNIKNQLYFAVSADAMEDQTTLDDAISDLYDFYKDEEEYLVLRAEIHLPTRYGAIKKDSWIKIDYFLAGLDPWGGWSVRSGIQYYFDNGAEYIELADIYSLIH